LMIHGLWNRAWYGYAFVLIFAVFGLTLLVAIHFARRRAAAELRKILHVMSDELGGP
jgi:hypothetical protein